MENNLSIEEYIASTPDCNIVKKQKNPIPALVVMLAGTALLGSAFVHKMPDDFKFLALSIGILAGIAGLVLVCVVVCGATKRYYYVPTKSYMKMHERYIPAADKLICADIIQNGNITSLENVRIETSTDTLLRILAAKNGTFALIQLCEYVPHSFVPTTKVLAVSGAEAGIVNDFLKK